VRLLSSGTSEEEDMEALSRVAGVSTMLACVLGAAAGAPTAGSATSSALPPGGKVVASIHIPAGTGAFAVGEGAVWAVSDSGPVLTRIDPLGNSVAASVKLELGHVCPAEAPGCGEAAVGNGALWVAHVDDGTVSRVDPRTNTVTATIEVGSRPLAVAVSPGAVWVANAGDPSLSRIDPHSNRVVATIRLGPHGQATDRMTVTAGAGAVWVTMTKPDAVLRVDPATNRVAATIALSWLESGQPCGFLAVAHGVVWAAGAHCATSSGYGVVTRIDPRTNAAAGTVSGFQAPIGLAVGFGSLWVADLDAKQIDRVDPRTGKLVARLPVGGLPIRVGVGFGSVWVRDDSGRVLRIAPMR
jgi:virginiamycin B lyase